MVGRITHTTLHAYRSCPSTIIRNVDRNEGRFAIMSYQRNRHELAITSDRICVCTA